MVKSAANSVQLIPIDRIHILNPRERDKRKFQEIVDNISLVGLKKPITVSRKTPGKDGAEFVLVCGQGRLEAFKILDQKEIPAFVVDLAEEDCYLQSLVENLARRQHSSIEYMHEISRLDERGYSVKEISSKIGLSQKHTRCILHLMKNGEERLLAAVDRNDIPITVAMDIANLPDKDIQRALAEAYNRNLLRGNKLAKARKLVQLRQFRGKKVSRSGGISRQRNTTADAMVRAYKQETEKQRVMILKADLTEQRLLIVVSALRELFADENLTTLLRAEGLDTLPRQIADAIIGGAPA